jgi:predicted MFS family arabinose efflux permease
MMETVPDVLQTRTASIELQNGRPIGSKHCYNNNDDNDTASQPNDGIALPNSSMLESTSVPVSDIESATPVLKTHQIVVIMLSLSASAFVSALDITIVSTALPVISGYFHSTSGYTWVGSAYVLANTATTPSWGKISDIWGRKPLLLAALTVFFFGSVMCGVAESMTVLIAGRAVQGVGAAGLNILVNICISDLFALRDRGMYFGLLSVVWACASGIGPVLGGVFSQELSYVQP